MSLRFQGSQLLQTSPSAMLAGASVVSLSIWVRVNPGCDVAGPSGVRLLGDGAGRLSVGLSGPGQLGVVWSPMGPTSAIGRSSFSKALVPGVSYHLAATWQDGLQRYFLNGQVLATDNQKGALGAPGGPTAPFRLGSDLAGADVTVEEPTLWVGYLLTGSDIVRLRDRIVRPPAIAPSSSVIRWTLAGPDGQVAAAGDPGLADGSPSGLSLVGVVGAAPTYVGGDLTYVAPANVGSVSVSPTGRTVVVDVVDSSGNPAAVASLRPNDDTQVISLIGEPAHGSFTLGFQGQTTVPIAVADNPPAVSATWTFSGLTAGVPYYIRFWWFRDPNNSQPFLVEVFDGPGGVRLQEGFFDRHIDYSPTYDFQALIQGDGTFVAVSATYPPGLPPAAVGVTPSRTSLVIRVTGPYGSSLAPYQVHCTPHDVSAMSMAGYNGHLEYVDGNDSPAYYQGLSTAALVGDWSSGDHATASGYGDIYTSSAPAIQSALMGLGGGVIPAGGVSVTGTVLGSGPDSGPFLVHFTGPMAGSAQASLVSSDPAVPVLHDDTGGSTVGGQHPSVTVDGSTIPLIGVLWGARSPDANGNPTTPPYLPLLVYPLPGTTTISPSSSVTFSAPSGFFSTAAGPAPTIVAIPAANPGSILPPPPASATMKLGYNIEPDTYFSNNRVYSNIGKMVTTTGGSSFPRLDANSYPLSMSQPSQILGLADFYADFGGSGQGGNCFPQGRYRFVWDGGVTLSPFPLSTSTTSTTISSVLTGTTDNEAVFDLRDSAHFSPGFYLSITTNAPLVGGQRQRSADGTYTCDLQNLRIYPPDPADPSGATAWAAPTKYYPSLAAQFGKAACFRTMNAMGTNNSNHVAYSDLIGAGAIGYSCATGGIFAKISRVEGYAGPDAYFTTGGGKTLILFTTAAAHGIADGQTVSLDGIGQVETAIGSFDPSGLSIGVRVLSPTTFTINSPANGSPMTNVLTPAAASVSMGITGNGMPFVDTVDLANFLACDLWLNIPALASDDCVRQMAAYVAANLDPALAVHVEWSNECWNYSFDQFYRCSGMSNTLLQAGYFYAPYQVYRSAQVQALFAAAFAAAGHPTGRVRRVIGTTPYPQGTATLLDVIQATPTPTTHDGAPATLTVDLAGGITSVVANGATTVLATFPPLGPFAFDEFACSDYISNDLFNSEGQLKPITDALDAVQTLDLLALKVASNQVRDNLRGHLSLLNASTLATKPKLAMYECNWDCILPFTQETGSFSVVPNQGPKTHAVQYHPDMYGITLGLIRQWQDAGVELANIFYLNGANSYASWNAYIGHSMAAGLGTEPGATNVSGPLNIPTNRSVFGAAVNRWLALAGASAPARLVPGRDARPSSKGYRAW